MTATKAAAQTIKCVVIRSEEIGDWWLIERAEHDGREWLEQTSDMGFSFRRSARLGPADIEGTSAEMLAIAAAIESGGDVSFRRCAAATTIVGVELESPRNSEYPTCITHECARALAADIRAKVMPVDSEGGGV